MPCPLPDKHVGMWLGFQLGVLCAERCFAEVEGNLSLACLKRQQVQEVLVALDWLAQRDRPLCPSLGQCPEEPLITGRRRYWSVLESEPDGGRDDGSGSGEERGEKKKRKRKRKARN